MNKEILKSLIIFLVLTAAVFYGAHLFAADSEVTFSTENARSTTFLNLVQVLQGIEFDLAFIESLNSQQRGLRRPVVVREVFDGRTGRSNPFAPASPQNTFSLVSPGTAGGIGFPGGGAGFPGGDSGFPGGSFPGIDGGLPAVRAFPAVSRVVRAAVFPKAAAGGSADGGFPGDDGGAGGSAADDTPVPPPDGQTLTLP